MSENREYPNIRQSPTVPSYGPVHGQRINCLFVCFFILHTTALRSWHIYKPKSSSPGLKVPADETSHFPRSSAWSKIKTSKNKNKNKRKAGPEESHPSLSSSYRRRSGSLLPLLFLLPPSCGPACLRLGVASAPANEDVDAHTPAPSYISPGWDAASRPHLLLPLPFPPLPLHLLPSLLRFNGVNTGRL
jgi:hypothetical protein